MMHKKYSQRVIYNELQVLDTGLESSHPDSVFVCNLVQMTH